MSDEWSEGAHPRAANGQFGGGGSGSSLLKKWGASKSSGGGVATPTTKIASKPGDVATGRDGVTISPGRKWSDKRPDGMAPQTYLQHFEGSVSKNKDNPLQNMRPTKERKARVHDPVVKAALAVPLPKSGEKKIAIMTMGGPASGKGTVLKQVSTAGTPMVLVDPDHVKGQLPEYRKAVPPKGSDKPTFKGAAAMVHEESSFIAKRIRNEAVAAGNHLIIDGTGTNSKKFIETMKDLKSKGYEVQVHFPHLEHDEGLKRAKSRAEGSGRYVPDAFISHSYSKIDNNVEKIMAAAKEHGASFHMYDAGKKGHPVSYSQKGGKETIHSQEHYSAFTGRTKRPDPG